MMIRDFSVYPPSYSVAFSNSLKSNSWNETNHRSVLVLGIKFKCLCKQICAICDSQNLLCFHRPAIQLLRDEIVNEVVIHLSPFGNHDEKLGIFYRCLHLVNNQHINQQIPVNKIVFILDGST